MASSNEWTPHDHRVRGRRGDGVPAAADVFVFTYRDGGTMTSSEWTVLSQLRADTESATVVHTYTATVEDSGDDAALDATQLRVTLQPLTAAETTALGAGVWHGDIQLSRTGYEPVTAVHFTVALQADVSRV